VALFLSWCQDHGEDWKTIGLPALGRFKHWLEATPIKTGRVLLRIT